MRLDELGWAVREDYTPAHREWLERLVTDLAREGLVEAAEERGEYVVRLPGGGEAADNCGGGTSQKVVGSG